MVLVAERQRLGRRDPNARDVVRAHDPGRQDRQTENGRRRTAATRGCA
jgi:hypothetical protein